jgi:hypothetical protein
MSINSALSPPSDFTRRPKGISPGVWAVGLPLSTHLPFDGTCPPASGAAPYGVPQLRDRPRPFRAAWFPSPISHLPYPISHLPFDGTCPPGKRCRPLRGPAVAGSTAPLPSGLVPISHLPSPIFLLLYPIFRPSGAHPILCAATPRGLVRLSPALANPSP